ncbi:DUF3828 domain-containing protein [Pantoea sp. C2G6]|uniref:DUF3828 domain-containing protein n=1 Tax=Pantoea sp. C2G6 TaxID=3243084 RepID=UPI003ED852D9
MKLLTHKLLHAFISISLFFCSNLAFSTDSTSPEDIVHDFYSQYLKDDSGNDEALVKKYVSDQLSNSIEDSTMCNYDSSDSVTASESESEKKCLQKRECKQYKGNYICDWGGFWIESDVNYFTKSQDVYPSWNLNIKTRAIMNDGSKSVIGIVLGNDSDLKKSLRVSLVKMKTGWKIISVTE